MDQTRAAFSSRVRGIEQSHQRRRLSGEVHMIRNDGLIVARPRRRAPRFPWRGAFMMLVAFIGFKAFVLGYLGPNAYEQRVDMLRSGNVVEQAGAWVMQADPLTVLVQNFCSSVVRSVL